MKQNPYLPYFLMPRKRKRSLHPSERFNQKYEEVFNSAPRNLSRIFSNLASFDILKIRPKERKRIYTRELTFWAYFTQTILHTSAASTVKKVQSWLLSKPSRLPSSNNSAFCQAKKRLPVEDLQDIYCSTNNRKKKPKENLYWNREVLLVDGTGLSMPDTKENQEIYPQNGSCKEGCGFPQMNVVAIFSLATGLLLDFVKGSKHDSEKRQWRQMWRVFQKDDIIVGDKGFCSYANIAFLKSSLGVDSIFRLGKQRKIDFSNARNIGKNQWLTTWKKSRVKNKGWTDEEWQELDDEITVRIIKISEYIPGFRTKDIFLASSLLDPKVYDIETVEELYLERWTVEVFFRDMKTSLKMDILKSKKPMMIEKELYMFAIAYNLIRLLILEASRITENSYRKVSFKGAIHQLFQWWDQLVQATQKFFRKIRELFLNKLADSLLVIRPRRSEPRALKRRWKSYQLLTKPRGEMLVTYHHADTKRKNALADMLTS